MSIFWLILSKLFYLFLFYLFILTISIFLVLFWLVIKKEIKLNKNNFSYKACRNEPYTLIDLKNDAPYILAWFIDKILNPKNLITYIIIFVFSAFSKFIQKINTLIISPFAVSFFLKKLYCNEEIKLNIQIKNNMTLLSLIKLIFFYIPLSYIFKNMYLILQAYHGKKIKKDLRKTMYNYATTRIAGHPIWFIDLVNRIYFNIEQSLNIDTKKKKKVFSIYCTLIFQDISDSFEFNENSLLNTTKKLRIYFIKEKIYFNPPKKILELKDTYSSIIKTLHSLTPKHSSVKHPILIFSQEKEGLQDGAPITHSPLPSQRSFSSKKFNEEKISHTVYNDTQEKEMISEKNKTTYKPNNDEILNKIARVEGHRATDSMAGINMQNKETPYAYVSKEGFYYENAIKLEQFKEKKTEFYNKMQEINNMVSSTSEAENWVTSLYNLDIKQWPDNTKTDLETNNLTFKNLKNNVEKRSQIADFKQEWTIDDSIQKNFENDIFQNNSKNTEEEIKKEKLNSPSKGMGGFNGEI